MAPEMMTALATWVSRLVQTFRNGLGLSEHEIGLLHSIWNKMSGRNDPKSKVSNIVVALSRAFFDCSAECSLCKLITYRRDTI